MKLTKNLSTIVLDHGTGGLLSQDLVTSFINPILGEVYLGMMEDSAILPPLSGQLAFTTDSFVIDPIFFKNGNIGKVAVCGTVNDLAVSGAKPLYITLALVLEEGFLLKDLETILVTIKETCIEADVKIVAGDTKVVRKGEIDKIFINTSGIGQIVDNSKVYSVNKIKNGDAIILTNQIGNHSIHILSMREGLGFESRVLSDCAPLNGMIGKISDIYSEQIHCIRDVTRGGLGTVLNEISQAVDMGIEIDMNKVPVQHETKMASDMLGVDPIYLANEGTACIFCSMDFADKILSILHKEKYGVNSAIIGTVNSLLNGVSAHFKDETRTLDHLYGMELPRLC